LFPTRILNPVEGTATSNFNYSRDIVQDRWALINLPDLYSSGDASTVLLRSVRGESHNIVNLRQRARQRDRLSAGQGAWSSTLKQEFNYAYGDLIAAGMTRRDAGRLMSQTYKYFKKIGAL